MRKPPPKTDKTNIFLPKNMLDFSKSAKKFESVHVLGHWLAVYGVWTAHTNTRSAKLCSQRSKKAVAETRDGVKWQTWKELEGFFASIFFFFFYVENMELMGFPAEFQAIQRALACEPPRAPISAWICPEGPPLRHHRRQPDITHHLSNSSLPAKPAGCWCPAAGLFVSGRHQITASIEGKPVLPWRGTRQISPTGRDKNKTRRKKHRGSLHS